MRAEGFGGEGWASARVSTETVGVSRSGTGAGSGSLGLALSLCAAEYQSLCPHGRGYLAPSGDPSHRRGEARL